MSERDITDLINDYVDGRLNEADTQRLLAELAKSAELRDRLALISVTNRLLTAAKSEPISSERVMSELQEKGLIKGPQPIRSSDQQQSTWALVVAVALVLLAVGGAGWWWRRSQSPMPSQSIVERASRPFSPSPSTVQTQEERASRPLSRPLETNFAVAPVPPVKPPPVEPEMVPVPELPLSAFEDGDSPPPQGDGSDEPGFVPPPEPGAAGTISPAVPGVTGGSATAMSPRDLPQAPLLFVKIRSDNPRNGSATPADLGGLLVEIKTRVGLAYRMEIKSLDEIDPNPEKNPVLYVTGHYHFAYTPAQRAKLRKFMLAGGMMVFDPGLGSKPFYDSARRELGIIFHDVRLQRLSADHPVFRAYYDVTHIQNGAGNDSWFDGVTVNCRTVAMISRWAMANGWERLSKVGDAAYLPDDATKLGVNLFAYAVAMHSGPKQPVYTVAMDQGPAIDKLFLGQVIYDGEWKTRPAALPLLLRTFNQRTEVPVKYGIKELRLLNPKIFDAPLLYITGHEQFVLSDDEVIQLRKYLLKGGFLFAEACCGRQGFDQAFRAEMKKVLPNQVIKPIPTDSDVYSIPNPVKRISVTPSLANLLGTSIIAPQLEGIEVGGHYAVIYSPYGMAASWEMCQNPYAFGYNDIGAIRLAQNILMYAITH